MDDSFCIRALLAIGIYVGHHIVTNDSFPFPGGIVIDVFRILF